MNVFTIKIKIAEKATIRVRFRVSKLELNKSLIINSNLVGLVSVEIILKASVPKVPSRTIPIKSKIPITMVKGTNLNNFFLSEVVNKLRDFFNN
jgi:hypothetical protein